MRSRFSLTFAAIVFAAALFACGGGGPPDPVPIPPPPPPPQPTVTQGDWYTYRHDTQRTACSGVVGPQNPRILFSIPGAGEPVFDSENTAYICCLGSGSEGSLAAVRDGEVLWALDAEEDGEPYTPFVHTDGSVYVGLSWAWKDDEETLRRYTHEHELSWSVVLEWPGAPTVSQDGSVFFCGQMTEENDFALIAFNDDGDLQWQFPEGHNVLMSPVIAPDGTLVVSAFLGATIEVDHPTVMKLYSLSGDVIWETALPFVLPEGHHTSEALPVIADDGTIYVVGWPGIHALSSSGEVLWSYYPAGDIYEELDGPTPRDDWPPALGPEGNIYASLVDYEGGYSSALIALSPSGQLLWRRDEHLWGSPIVDAAGTIYIASGDGETWCYTDSVSQAEQMEPRNSVIAINANGTTKWEFSALDELEVGMVLCMDNEGNLVISGRDPDGDPWEERLFWIGDA